MSRINSQRKSCKDVLNAFWDISKRFNNVKVVPNIRFGDRCTYRTCYDGIRIVQFDSNYATSYKEVV